MENEEMDEKALSFVDMDSEEFVRCRLTELRELKEVSESKLCDEIGFSRSYFNQIANGKILPKMRPFFCMLNYLGISKEDFFNADLKNPYLTDIVYKDIMELSTEDLKLVLDFIHRLKK